MGAIDTFDEYLLHGMLFLVSLVVFHAVVAFTGVRVNAVILLGEAIVLGTLFFLLVPGEQKGFSRLNYLVIFLLLVAVVLYSVLLKYFEVVGWDGAVYLSNARMLLTHLPLLYAFYKPLLWSSFLSLGIIFGKENLVPLLNVVMVVASTYLLTLSLTRNKVAGIYALLFSLFVPCLLLLGLSYYAESFLVVLFTLGFACYFFYLQTHRHQYYFFAVFLFACASLTRFTFILLLIVPLIEMIKRRLWWQTVLPCILVFVPYLMYIQVKTKSVLYPFVMYLTTFEQDVTHNFFTNSYYFLSMNSLFTWLLLVLGVVGLVLLMIRKFPQGIGMLFLAIALQVAFFLFASHLKDIRYLMFIFPTLLVGVGYFFGLYEHTLNIFIRVFAVVVLGLLLFNFKNEVYPQYHYSGLNIAKQVSDELKDVPGGIMSNNHVVLTWYMNREVIRAVEVRDLNATLQKKNITFFVNFEHSGIPASFKNTTALQQFGTLEESYTDGYERINVIRVEGTTLPSLKTLSNETKNK